MAIDPVCGMTVDPERNAGSFDFGGHTYYFCSKGCLAKFSAEPQRYLAPKPAPAIVSIGGLKKPAPKPPAVPKGAAPPEASDAPEYTCPMHPEIVSSRPGA